MPGSVDRPRHVVPRVPGASAVSQVQCVDCIAEGVTNVRPIASGTRKPRCTTHTRAVKKRAQINAHGRMVQITYGLTSEQYWALYEAQGGRCAICAWATGKTKRLAVDHDHELAKTHDHDPDKACPACVRGLLCGPCNQMIGRLGNESFVRAIEYRLDPPARRFGILT